MKKKQAIGLAAAALLCACTPKVPENEYLIQGKLANVEDSTIIGLYRTDGQLFRQIAQDTVFNGEFSFGDTISATQKLQIMSHDEGFPNMWLDVWVAPGQRTRISGNDKLITTWNVESDLPEQKEANGYQAVTLDVTSKLAKLQAEEAGLLQQFIKEGANNKLLWGKIDSLRKLENPLRLQECKQELEYMKTIPVTPDWLDRLENYASFLQHGEELMPYRAEIEELYARLSDSEKQTPKARSVDAYLHPLPVVNVGDEMADADLYDTEGGLHHLAELKGKYILLDFWSRGCGPCVQSVPEMEKIIDKYKEKLAVVGISIDGKESWKKYVAEHHMKGYQWNELRADQAGLYARYQVHGIPHYVLIDPSGKVQKMWAGYAPGSLERALDGQLK